MLKCLTLWSQQNADSDQWVQHEIALAYKPLSPFLLFIFTLFSLCLYICCISTVNMLLARRSLKVIYSPCRETGLRAKWHSQSGQCVWPEGRSQGLMKTNPSLCCPGNRPQNWLKGCRRALGYTGGQWNGWKWKVCVQCVVMWWDNKQSWASRSVTVVVEVG